MYTLNPVWLCVHGFQTCKLRLCLTDIHMMMAVQGFELVDARFCWLSCAVGQKKFELVLQSCIFYRGCWSHVAWTLSTADHVHICLYTPAR